jgi:hypothetical protein
MPQTAVQPLLRLSGKRAYQAEPFDAGIVPSLSVEFFAYDTGRSPSIGITTTMQFVGKLTEADLNGVRKNTRSKRYWHAVRLAAESKLVFRCCAVLVALASTAALSLAGVLSVGCYGAATLLGRVRPLRNAYQLLSRAYDRHLDRLGQEVLRDPRDAPALRLMVSLSAVPIFLIQLVLGKPRLLLAIAFYLSL